MSLMPSLSRWFSNEDCLDPADATTHAAHLLASLMTMAWAVEARDPYTGGHLWRVSRYARLVADRLGYSEADAARVSLGGFLHDLGKIAVPDAILRKPGPLSDEEYAVIKTHPDVGRRLLAGHPLADLVQDAVLLHHERPDGRGYPLGLAGEVIPPMARIVGVCDAFDAMTSHRPYRAGMHRDRALSVIGEVSGAQFDRHVANTFLQMGGQGVFDHVISHSDEGIPLRECPMCGPTLVIRREHHAGDHVYCRNCTGEFELKDAVEGLMAFPTGGKGGPADLEPDIDTALIARTVQAAVAALPAQDLLKACAMPVPSKR